MREHGQRRLLYNLLCRQLIGKKYIQNLALNERSIKGLPISFHLFPRLYWRPIWNSDLYLTKGGVKGANLDVGVGDRSTSTLGFDIGRHT